MKRGLITILAIFLLLAACAPKETAQPQPTQPSEPGQTVTISGTPTFKIIVENAKRTPATVFGIIKNIGNATGNAKVTARIFYAKVIVDEKTQTIDDIEPGKEANFSIAMKQEDQWTSYKTTVEVAS